MSDTNELKLSKKLDILVEALLKKTQTGDIEWTRIYNGEFPFEYEYHMPHGCGRAVRVAMDNRGSYPRYSFSLLADYTIVYEDCHSTAEESTWLGDQIEELFTAVQLADSEVMDTLDRMIEDINEAIGKDK